jgi:uncharacterized protein YfbU (UPF0304 family)
MATVDLTDFERLSLANQFEILALLKKDTSCQLLSDTLRNGNEWLYHQELERHLHPLMSSTDSEAIITVLTLFRSLNESYEKLADQSGIDSKQIRFEGFDGSDEIQQLAFCDDLRRYGLFTETLNEKLLNAHTPMTEVYVRMVNQWALLGRPATPLSKENIEAIVNARILSD